MTDPRPLHSQECRAQDAIRETNLPMVLRPNEALVLYNAVCTFCDLGRRAEAIDALRKAWDAGFGNAEWTRTDSDLASLRGDPEFESSSSRQTQPPERALPLAAPSELTEVASAGSVQNNTNTQG